MIKHEIARTLKNSIARKMGISRGDFLRAINNEEVRDILDYRFKVAEEFLLVEIEKADGEIWEIEIEKDTDEDLGIEFKQSLMSGTRRCRNNCVFCFVDQQPKGLRNSLYVKDDDARLSFLLGNYVTLTNLDEDEVKRLAGYHLSPLRISVHAADLDLREKMMGTSAARNLFDAIAEFEAAGIEMHFQIVLCKGLNDGDKLVETVEKLAAIKTAKSLAIVPVGLTKHREGLLTLEGFGREDARKVIVQVAALAVGLDVYLSDEWYVLAGEKLPRYEEYGNFPQLDNGVGVLRLFEREFGEALKKCRKCKCRIIKREMRSNSPDFTHSKHIGIVTGKAAAGFMRAMAGRFMKCFPIVKISVYVIENKFFGSSVTVSGLLAGQDVIAQLAGMAKPDVFFLPENAFRAGVEEKVMLDGVTLGKLRGKLGVRVGIGSIDGAKFCRQLMRQISTGN